MGRDLLLEVGLSFAVEMMSPCNIVGREAVVDALSAWVSGLGRPVACGAPSGADTEASAGAFRCVLSTAYRHQRTVQGGGSAVGSIEPSVGEDYLPLHESITNSKLTTCCPLHMVVEVHHTKSGYEQLESRNSHCRPTRS